jgi:hypothetical protein
MMEHKDAYGSRLSENLEIRLFDISTAFVEDARH